ncbi:DUF916 and DUF3324 domain-containing protein [Enterococcus hirae]|uniref:DUF916 and DUF3324 domain-containing protein n=2 Tax=Enterococcus hirae TaxID=1354 RepID=UPI001F2371E6|nr:DUF916 and DUF3324 domain-containing protein [Enterococcus hirae]MCR1913774.1 DUF916 and DUF3324 domain-containing protein [Enterococcus hirae]
MKKFLIMLGLFMTMFFGMNASLVFAENVNNDEQPGGYTIEGIPNEHQIDPTSGYFYLDEDPGSKDEIKVKLTNSSGQDKTLLVKITDANTNINGIVDYTGQLKNHSLLKVPLTSIVHATQKEVVVPKNSSVETTLNVTMPKEPVEGIILGGVVVSEKQEDHEKNKGLSVGNTYSYTIGIALTNHAETPIKKNVSVELEKVGPTLFDGRKIIQADILNPNPYVFSQAEVAGDITYLKDNKVVKSKKMENVSIAPYSSFPFQFDWNKEELKPGKYLFKGTVKTKEKTWKFEKEFEIKEDQAKKINKESVFKLQIPNWLNISCILLLILSIVNIILLLIRRSKYSGRKPHEK